jgi:hypothetical protein
MQDRPCSRQIKTSQQLRPHCNRHTIQQGTDRRKTDQTNRSHRSRAQTDAREAMQQTDQDLTAADRLRLHCNRHTIQQGTHTHTNERRTRQTDHTRTHTQDRPCSRQNKKQTD